MATLLFTFALSVFPLLAQAGPSCPSGSELTTRITKFVIGATPDRVFDATGDFFNAKCRLHLTFYNISNEPTSYYTRARSSPSQNFEQPFKTYTRF